MMKTRGFLLLGTIAHSSEQRGIWWKNIQYPRYGQDMAKKFNGGGKTNRAMPQGEAGFTFRKQGLIIGIR